MITLSGVSVSFGARTVLAAASLQVVARSRVAVVGPNGAGKTTLLDLVAGEREPDAGAVQRARDVMVGYLRQEVAATRGRSVLDEVLAAADVTGLEARLHEVGERLAAAPPGAEQDALLDEYGRLQDRFEHLGGYAVEAEAQRILAGLGFGPTDGARDVGELSGGWTMRVALARLLLARPDVLLLDEPTNHLDLDSVAWFESWLATYPGAVVLVSHDREFVNAVADRVVEVARGAVTEYAGDYDAFVAQRDLRAEQAAAARRNQDRKIAQTERFVERFRYKATKARQVQSRVKALEKLERVDVPDLRVRAARFGFPPPPRAGRVVARLDGVTKRYGDRIVYAGLDLVVERDQRIALVGPNGAGKSTLLRVLAGDVAIEGGSRELGLNVVPAYYAQHTADSLQGQHDREVADGAARRTAVEELLADLDEATRSRLDARRLLGAFLFPGDDADKPVRVLSGGERARLALAKIMVRPANLLLLDEPTNHLDIVSRDVLEAALLAYPGTLVLVTHDRHLIRSVADTIVECRDGSATAHLGGWDDYLRRKAADAEATGTDRTSQPSERPQERPQERLRREAAERRAASQGATGDLRREVARLEAELGEAEAEVAELTRRLGEPDVYADNDAVKDLVARHGLAKDRAAELTRRWEGAYTRLEAANVTAEQRGEG